MWPNALEASSDLNKESAENAQSAVKTATKKETAGNVSPDSSSPKEPRNVLLALSPDFLKETSASTARSPDA